MHATEPLTFDPAGAWQASYAPTSHDLWTRTNVGEVFPSVVTPLTFSIIVALGEAVWVAQPDRLKLLPRRLFQDGRPPAAFRAINGRMFYNTGLVHHIFTDVFGLPSWFWMLSLGGPQDASGRYLAKRPFHPTRALRALPKMLTEARRLRDVVAAFERDQASMRAAAADLGREDLGPLSETELIARLARVAKMAEAPEAQLFDGSSAALNAYGILAGLCERWCGDRALANDLVTGLATMSTANATLALWDVVRAAAAHPAALPIIREGPAADVRQRLRHAPEAAPVAAALDDFFTSFGHRCADEFELAVPRWSEDATFIVTTLRTYLDAPAAVDPAALLARQRLRRVAAEREARRRMQPSRLHQVAPYRWFVFRAVLREAQRLLPMRENPKHHFLLFAAELRRTILALARRLAARGMIDAPADAFFLTRDELAAAAGSAERDLPAPGVPLLVAARRALYARYQTWSPPEAIPGSEVEAVERALREQVAEGDAAPSVGFPSYARGPLSDRARDESERPLAPPAVDEPDEATHAPSPIARGSEPGSATSAAPAARAQSVADQTMPDPRDPIVAPRQAGEKHSLRGIAASGGVVTAPARIVLTPEDGASIEPGDVLVAPFTDPGWTPLFTIAAAVVMDLGGLLSHGAIVAREYGIPAVVNTRTATTALRTGQMITVDGGTGAVTWEDDGGGD